MNAFIHYLHTQLHKGEKEHTQNSYKNKILLTNIFSNERFASQQFRNTGINKCLMGGHNIYFQNRRRNTLNL